MSNLAALAAKANEITSTVDAARIVIQQLRDDLATAIADDDPAAIQAIVDQLDAAGDSLAAAIASQGNPDQPQPEVPPVGPAPEPEPEVPAEPEPEAPVEEPAPEEPTEPEVPSEG